MGAVPFSLYLCDAEKHFAHTSLARNLSNSVSPRRSVSPKRSNDAAAGYSRGEPHEPEGTAIKKVLSPTKARVARGLQDLLIDLKEIKADNRRLEDLLRQEQTVRTK